MPSISICIPRPGPPWPPPPPWAYAAGAASASIPTIAAIRVSFIATPPGFCVTSRAHSTNQAVEHNRPMARLLGSGAGSVAFLVLLARAARTWIVAPDVRPVGRRRRGRGRGVERTGPSGADHHRILARSHLFRRWLGRTDVHHRRIRVGRLVGTGTVSVCRGRLVLRNVLENSERVVPLRRLSCRLGTAASGAITIAGGRREVVRLVEDQLRPEESLGERIEDVA